jgi:PhnB protein
MAVKPIAEGYHSITPLLVPEQAGKLIDFLKQAFDAKELHRMAAPDGTIMHAELIIGDSRVMLGEATGEQKPMPCSLYLYVPDADAVYKRAVQAGAVTVTDLADQFWGDRTGSVRDPAGNIWWIATHKEDVAPDEMRRRAEAAMGRRTAGR